MAVALGAYTSRQRGRERPLIGSESRRAVSLRVLLSRCCNPRARGAPHRPGRDCHVWARCGGASGVGALTKDMRTAVDTTSGTSSSCSRASRCRRTKRRSLTSCTRGSQQSTTSSSSCVRVKFSRAACRTWRMILGCATAYPCWLLLTIRSTGHAYRAIPSSWIR